MDTSFLTQQVTSIIGQLHTIFDEIGIPHHARDARESELFSSLSETLHAHLRQVSKEKNDLIDEGQGIITTIRQMESSLEDPRPSSNYPKKQRDDLDVTYPLIECLEQLREKHRTVNRLHQERYEQVKKLVEALQSYSAHLEPSFIQVKLPPIGPNAKVSPSFDLSPSYIAAVDKEFSRVYEEYMKRRELVQQISQETINLWAELGTPQAQTDATLVQHWRDAPEQLGMHQSDLDRLMKKRDALKEEKNARERKVVKLKTEIEGLWDRLGVEDKERKAFLSTTRGCGLRTINDLEGEMMRLNELKHQNLHLFVEDARTKLANLWDELYISEEEAVEFTPMFCDVFSDALLSAHEQEIARLEALKEQRAPLLALVAKHRGLMKDRDDLASSSQDASRLMSKGAKGEKRDPGKLLREEKMRKRITRELPKVEQELAKALTAWEDEFGRDFLVFGERYLDEIEITFQKTAVPPRSKTPTNFAATTTSKAGKAAPPSISRPPTRAEPTRSKTPVSNATIGRGQNPLTSTTRQPAGAKSPSRIPARVPLGSRTDGGNSPERRPQTAAGTRKIDGNSTIRGMKAPPPPKMRPFEAETPTLRGPPTDDLSRSGSVVCNIHPEDPYRDVYSQHASLSQAQPAKNVNQYHDMPPPPRPAYRPPPAQHHEYAETDSVVSMTSRQLSQTSSINSHGTTAPSSVAPSTSENWETFGSDDDDEFPQNDAYYAKMKAASAKRAFNGGAGPGGYVDGRFEGYAAAAEGGPRGGGAMVYGPGGNKRPKAVREDMVTTADGNGRDRIVSAGAGSWTDDGEVF